MPGAMMTGSQAALWLRCPAKARRPASTLKAMEQSDLVRFFELFIMLAMGHCLADYPLQTDRMAVEKCAGKDVTLSWKWWLSAHAGVHGLVVGLITGIPALGLAEWMIHIAIDYGKCRHMYKLAADQGFHMLCKVAWAAIVVAPNIIK